MQIIILVFGLINNPKAFGLINSTRTKYLKVNIRIGKHYVVLSRFRHARTLCQSSTLPESNFSKVRYCLNRTFKKFDIAWIELYQSSIVLYQSSISALSNFLKVRPELCQSSILPESNFCKVRFCLNRTSVKFDIAWIELLKSSILPESNFWKVRYSPNRTFEKFDIA